MELALSAAGYRLEGPGTAEQRELQGLFWWTLARPGWTGCETSSGEWPGRTEAIVDAYVHLLADSEFWN